MAWLGSPNAAPVSPGDRLHDCEAEPSPSLPARSTRIDAMKPPEHPLTLVDRDPGPVVHDCKSDPIGSDPLDFQPHNAMLLGRVLDGIARQVSECLGQPVRICSQ